MYTLKSENMKCHSKCHLLSPVNSKKIRSPFCSLGGTKGR